MPLSRLSKLDKILIKQTLKYLALKGRYNLKEIDDKTPTIGD